MKIVQIFNLQNSVFPKEPGYVFAIDVSYNNIKSGLVNLLCSRMLTILESLPSHTPVGFITYNSKVSAIIQVLIICV